MVKQDGEFFGELLQRLRKRTHLTQAALAERIGAHRTTVSFWERGEYVPETLTTVLEIARVLQLTEADTRLLVEARFGTASILPFHTLPDANPYFTGREGLLEQLHAALTAGESVALVQPQAISGLGGIGKTQLALAYAYRYRTHYHDMLWALAESPETLTAAYLSFAEYLRLDLPATAEQQRVVEAVKRWLRGHKGWLLILDNIEDLHLVRAFVPTPRQGAVLLTTRHAETSPVARPLPLDGLGVAEGSLFLLRRAGLLALEAPLQVASQQQLAAAQSIVEALGRLPLALDQAGAYVAETRCSLFDYLALLQQEQATLLARRGTVPSEHPASVMSTFALAFERAQQQSEAASDLLKLCAYLAPDAIPLDLFRHGGVMEVGPVLAPIAAQMLAFNAALETLQAYSLIGREAEAQTLSLHRLVQGVQQEILPEAEQRLWAERVVRLVSSAFPLEDAENWERCQQLLPHALLCARHIERWDINSLEAASLLRRAGYYLYTRGAYEQALPLLHQALDLHEQSVGANHADAAQTLDILALLFRVQGQYEQALPLAQRALSIRERLLGPDHPDVAQTLNILALLYRAQGHYATAITLAERALTISEQALGPTHTDVAFGFFSLSNLHFLQGQYERAVLTAQRAITITEDVHGSSHSDIAAGLKILARVYLAQGWYTQALPLAERALAICEQTLGPGHAFMAIHLNTLAQLYQAQGQHAQALPFAQQALTICEQTLGPEHVDVASSLNILAQLYTEQRHFSQAQADAERALALREQALGTEHPETAESVNTLARLYETQGLDAEALPLYQRALTILQRVLPDHPDTATTQQHVAALTRRMEHGGAISAGDH